MRIIEVCIQNVGLLRGINTDAAGSIWRSPSADEPRLVLIGDSFSNGQGSGASNTTRLTFPHFMAQRLGVTNIYCSANGGTGYLNPGGSNGTFRERVINGDLDLERVGAADAVILFGSVNDTSGYGDAAIQAEVAATIALVRTRQPEALVIGIGPQTTLGTTTPQARHDAMQEGFNDGADGDPRCRWIDSSPAGEGWFTNSARNAAIIGPDNTHLNDAGMRLIGYRAAASILNSVARSGLAG